MIKLKLLIGGIAFIPLIAVLCNFGFGRFWFSERSEYQTLDKKLKQFSANAVSNQHSSASNKADIAQVNIHIFRVPNEFQGKIIQQAQLSKPDKVIALTFDDGPAPKYTQQVLQILKQQNIKATFFCVGEMVHYFPQIAKLEVAEGHAIGNHTWHHWYRKMNLSVAAREIESTATAIYQTMGVKTSLFRPPYGILNNGVADYAKKNNYAVLMWSDDSIDYRRPPVSRLVNNVLKYAKPGGIVLMHDGGGDRSHTVKALPQIIASLKQHGYKFVTIPELLEMQAKKSPLTTAQFHQEQKGA
ncbi:polysaccharide deacetylase (plasmid) [Nostoc linckia NIES-25]|nr:polysaccharide deacetylase [Calothrix brevissima NIES-22]BAY80229.1 polysaccharide deacetylase [Nostoc linckia NIES-25]